MVQPVDRLSDRALDELQRAAALGVAQVGLQADLDQGRVGAREEVGEARLRHAEAEIGVEDELVDEVRVVDRRHARQAVLEGDAQRRLDELRVRELTRLLRELVLPGLWEPLPCGELACRLGRRRPLLGALLALGLEAALDLADRGVDERARPVDHLHRALSGELGALVRKPRKRLRRLVARETALEADEPPEVGGEDRVLEVAVDHHHHGLVAELPVELVRGAGCGRVPADERARGRARLEAQGEGESDHRQRADHGHRRHGVVRHRPGQRAEAVGRAAARVGRPPAPEQPSHHGPQLKPRLRYPAPLGRRRARRVQLNRIRWLARP